jgi:hypothetical protein
VIHRPGKFARISGYYHVIRAKGPVNQWFEEEMKMKPAIALLMIAVVAFAMGCSSVPQRRALLDQVARDTQGVHAEILSFDSSNRVATVRYHHRIVYGKTSAAQYRFDGRNWEMIQGSSNHASQAIGAPGAPQPER